MASQLWDLIYSQDEYQCVSLNGSDDDDDSFAEVTNLASLYDSVETNEMPEEIERSNTNSILGSASLQNSQKEGDEKPKLTKDKIYLEYQNSPQVRFDRSVSSPHFADLNLKLFFPPRERSLAFHSSLLRKIWDLTYFSGDIDGSIMSLGALSETNILYMSDFERFVEMVRLQHHLELREKRKIRNLRKSRDGKRMRNNERKEKEESDIDKENENENENVDEEGDDDDFNQVSEVRSLLNRLESVFLESTARSSPRSPRTLNSVRAHLLRLQLEALVLCGESAAALELLKDRADPAVALSQPLAAAHFNICAIRAAHFTQTMQTLWRSGNSLNQEATQSVPNSNSASAKAQQSPLSLKSVFCSPLDFFQVVRELRRTSESKSVRRGEARAQREARESAQRGARARLNELRHAGGVCARNPPAQLLPLLIAFYYADSNRAKGYACLKKAIDNCKSSISRQNNSSSSSHFPPLTPRTPHHSQTSQTSQTPQTSKMTNGVNSVNSSSTLDDLRELLIQVYCKFYQPTEKIAKKVLVLLKQTWRDSRRDLNPADLPLMLSLIKLRNISLSVIASECYRIIEFSSHNNILKEIDAMRWRAWQTLAEIMEPLPKINLSINELHPDSELHLFLIRRKVSDIEMSKSEFGSNHIFVDKDVSDDNEITIVESFKKKKYWWRYHIFSAFQGGEFSDLLIPEAKEFLKFCVHSNGSVSSTRYDLNEFLFISRDELVGKVSSNRDSKSDSSEVKEVKKDVNGELSEEVSDDDAMDLDSEDSGEDFDSDEDDEDDNDSDCGSTDSDETNRWTLKRRRGQREKELNELKENGWLASLKAAITDRSANALVKQFLSPPFTDARSTSSSSFSSSSLSLIELTFKTRVCASLQTQDCLFVCLAIQNIFSFALSLSFENEQEETNEASLKTSESNNNEKKRKYTKSRVNNPRVLVFRSEVWGVPHACLRYLSEGGIDLERALHFSRKCAHMQVEAQTSLQAVFSVSVFDDNQEVHKRNLFIPENTSLFE